MKGCRLNFHIKNLLGLRPLNNEFNKILAIFGENATGGEFLECIASFERVQVFLSFW